MTELATGGKSSHLPYADIERRQSVFIAAKYLPKKAKIRQPRNMPKQVIQEIFEHLLERQGMDGPEQAFRFASIKSGKKIVNACYPNGVADADARRPGRGRAGAVADPDPPHTPPSNPSHPMAPQLPTLVICHDEDHRPIDARPALPNSADAVTHEHYDADGLQADPDCNEATFVIIGDDDMTNLNRSGIPMPVPCNGPDDGQPRYPVPCGIYKAYITRGSPVGGDSIPDITRMDQLIDPALLTMPTPMPTPSPTPTPIRPRIARKVKEKRVLPEREHVTKSQNRRRR